ncbi:hypothetical protein [Ensifer sp. Root278]|uniref:hypothetical protein n=1 Tax=unclassified Ensifer TaxID=2633371 RepID=UPI000AFF137D|nr:hypothetical protein [Ensifer sp. Root278]
MPLARRMATKRPLGLPGKKSSKRFSNVIRHAGYPLEEKALLVAQERMSLFVARQAPAA